MLDKIRIVLVEPSHPGNIGAVARAMKNMGLSDLCLVNPKSFPDEAAIARATDAVDVLQAATVVATLDEATAGSVKVFATSARSRTLPWEVVNPAIAATKAKQFSAQGKVSFVFGRESKGLSNQELQQSDIHVQIPTADFRSLNLAMAVQVIAYELFLAANDKNQEIESIQFELATHDEIEQFFQHLQQALTDINFYRPDVPRQTLQRLRRTFTRLHLEKDEVNLLRGILTKAQQLVSK